MRVLFLGTAAATAFPMPFCGCSVCRNARRFGGKNLRRRSSVLIDDCLLIDLGPDFMSASYDFGFDPMNIRYLLQTHSHSDHFDAGHFITRIPDYAVSDVPRMTVCASEACLEHMSEKLSREEGGASLLDPVWQEKLSIDVHAVRHGNCFTLGEYEILCLESLHDVSDGSMMYLIKNGNASFLYACDTNELSERVQAILEDPTLHITAAAIDQTYGPDTPGGGHLYANQVAEIVQKLPETRIFATHLSHEGNLTHEALSAWAQAHGYEIAYDGMTLEL